MLVRAVDRNPAPLAPSRHATSVACAVALSSTTAGASPFHETVGGVAGEHPYVSRTMRTRSEAATLQPALPTNLPASESLNVVVIGKSRHVGLAPRAFGLDVSDAIYDASQVGPERPE